jgi:glutamate-1-semialdehyde 2,1-aminomutase
MMSIGAYHGSHDIVSSGPGIPESYLSLVTRYAYNDEESFVGAFKRDKAELGAVMMEGVLGAAGSAPPTKSFIKTVREETEKAGVPFIIDEVVTGFRVRRGGISEMMGVKPDGVTLGKIIGGGFPVGAFLGEGRLMREFEYAKADFPLVGKASILQSGTFNAHPVSMAAGLATLEVLTPDAYAHLAWLGSEASKIMDRLATEHRVPHAMTGLGSLFFMHFSEHPVNNFESAQTSDERKGRILDALMLSHGVSMPAFHSAFTSLPMGKSELAQFELAVGLSFEDMKMLELI